ncbi:uncharacterized protein LOC112560665 [Pomacea canaliculata]|uniref:uncharacterized protein LOC112560665 n=1 Tax=Pomacea canaliculata TaxID=400727 RepID=UPI000D727E5F|nr:uncharacterized protein LOC112560665 [Pomacea canaliculata]
MTTSSGVVNLVAKKLKYYFDVKRLEDGFDLSDVHSPVLNHPPLKARPTLQYDGLHDRALKHYFSQPEVRVHLTRLDVVDSQMQNPREKKVKKTLKKQMRKYHYLLTVPDLPPAASLHQKSPIPECYYVYTKDGIKLQPKLVGFGSAPKSQKKSEILRGGWPLLRSAPPTNLPRSEAERLINSASKLLVATTDWDLVDTREPSHLKHADKDNFEPHQKDAKRRPLTAKYTWDVQGHRGPSAKIKVMVTIVELMMTVTLTEGQDSHIEPERDSSPTSTSSTTSESSRPTSPPPRPPSPLPKADRPKSARHRHHTIINMPQNQIQDEVHPVGPSPCKSEVGSQTDKHLLEKYDQMEEEVKQGPKGEYRVHVVTGKRIGSSTNADVKLVIYGDKGHTPELMLQESKYNKVKFQRGKEDLFILTAHHVGKMKKIKIGHDRPQLNFAWYLENITIHDINDKRTYYFPCQRWFSGQDDDHRTYRVLPVDREYAFVDAPDTHDLAPKKSEQSKQSESETSDSESDFVPKKGRKKDKTSLRAKHSQRSSKLSSSTSSSNSKEVNKGAAVIQMSASASSESKKTLARKEKEELLNAKMPGTVIQLQKKDSEKVEEEIHLNEGGKDGQTAATGAETLPGHKTSLEASEEKERRKKEDQRASDRQLLSGPTVHDAARSGDLHRIQELLEKFPEMKDFKDESGWTPLHLASANGHVDIIKWLTSSSHDDLDVETPTGYTSIHVAAMNGHIRALTVLNAMGASLTCKTVEKHTPLHLAARKGDLECVRWLIGNGADLQAEDNFGRTPEHLAREYGHDIVADLLRVSERDLKDPNSSLAQMHRAMQRKGSAALPTITEAEDKASSSSDKPEVGSISIKAAHKKSKAEDDLKQRRNIYEEQHRRMEKQEISFLDSIRQDVEDEA